MSIHHSHNTPAENTPFEKPAVIHETKTLLGVDHGEMFKHEVAQLRNSACLGIASVVDVEWKTHNFVNNEDACCIASQENCEVYIVADAHAGYMASHEAVKRFPSIIETNLKSSTSVEQALVDSILKLFTDIKDIGRRSGIKYERYGREYADSSVTMFAAVVKVADEYYAVNLGDTSIKILRSKELIDVPFKTDKMGILGGGISPRYYMRDSHDREAPGLSDDQPTPFNDPLVRKAIDVKKLEVKAGDRIVMWTDGFDDAPKVFGGVIMDLLSDVSISSGLNKVFELITPKPGKLGDNVALVVVEVEEYPSLLTGMFEKPIPRNTTPPCKDV